MKPTDRIERLIKEFEVKPGAVLRERMLADTLRAYEQTKVSVGAWPMLWRLIMNKATLKFAIAATVIIVAYFAITLPGNQNGKSIIPQVGGINLLAEALANEKQVYLQSGIVHVVSEITIYPEAGKMGSWMPLANMKADGKAGLNQLKMPAKPEPYKIIDDSYYESATGKFVRILRQGETFIFANSFDGNNVYLYNQTEKGVSKNSVSSNFQPPTKPAEYLGIAVGVEANFEKNPDMLKEAGETTLSDGGKAKIFRSEMKDPSGKVNAYCQATVRISDKKLVQVDMVINGETMYSIGNATSQRVDKPGISWDLSGCEKNFVPTDIKVISNMVVPDASVEDMVKGADYETYAFQKGPAWCGKSQIMDVLDVASPGHRMYIIAYKADDGRDVVLVQSYSYNQMLCEKMKQGTVTYTSPNGFKIISGGPSKWMANILLSSSRSAIKHPVSNDCEGYFLESPAVTYPVLAVNGKITDEELHTLVDALVPAKELIKN